MSSLLHHSSSLRTDPGLNSRRGHVDCVDEWMLYQRPLEGAKYALRNHDMTAFVVAIELDHNLQLEAIISNKHLH